MRIKRGLVELFVIVAVIAVAGQWFANRGRQSHPTDSNLPTAILASSVEDYAVDGLRLGMSLKQVTDILRPGGTFEKVRFDSNHQVCWIKGLALTHPATRPGHSGSPPGQLLCNALQSGVERGQVLKCLGPPVAHNDMQSRWGYWTQNLANQEMGILIAFSDEQIEYVEVASKWSDLAGHLFVLPTGASKNSASSPSKHVDHIYSVP